MPFEFGDVVLVSFPFTSQTSSKQRPALVVSSGTYNLSRPDTIMMPITSQQVPSINPLEVPVIEWQAAGLLKPSMLKPVLATLEQRLVIRQLGRFTSGDKARVKIFIGQLLG